MSGSISEVEKIETSKSAVSLLRTIKKDDTTYDLYVCKCACCEEIIYRVTRCNGASFSVYQISRDDCDDLEAYVDELHKTLAVDVATKLTTLIDCVADRNSRGFFNTEGMSPFRVAMVDKARLIASRLSKKGLLDEIKTKHNDLDHDVASAFILGCGRYSVAQIARGSSF